MGGSWPVRDDAAEGRDTFRLSRDGGPLLQSGLFGCRDKLYAGGEVVDVFLDVGWEVVPA